MPILIEKAVPTAGTIQHTEGSTQPTWCHDTTTATVQPHAAPGTGQISPRVIRQKITALKALQANDYRQKKRG